MAGSIAVLNAGSSSIKFAVYDEVDLVRPLIKGQVEQIGVAPRMEVFGADGARISERVWPTQGFDHRTATAELITMLREMTRSRPVMAVAHRVVHGGTRYAAPIRVDGDVIAYLKTLTPLAPLHQPHNLAPIVTIAEAAPNLPQVACFDTAFHRSQPHLAQLFAIPRKFTDAGVRRYGFHGLSYEYVAARLRELAPTLASGKVIVAHLGNGASLCAMENGRSVASTMGFTAVDGLMMGTRSGSLDPGVVIHLMDAFGMGPRDIEAMVYKQSGLLGVSGISPDMRTLRQSDDPAAREAVDLFIYRIVRDIGSMAAALGGIDGLVFTAGIGQNDAATRAEVSEGCRWLGLRLDADRNVQSGARIISADGSKVTTWVVPTDEERMMAQHSRDVLALA